MGYLGFALKSERAIRLQVEQLTEEEEEDSMFPGHRLHRRR